MYMYILYIYNSTIMHVQCRHLTFDVIREYSSTLYVGMTRGENGARIKRVH